MRAVRVCWQVAFLAWAVVWAPLAAAHEVHLEVGAAAAAVLTLRYADGTPFAFEAYELYPDGQNTPAQVGRTDGQGRAVFLPGERTAWRVRAFSADGHGLDQPLTLTVAASPTHGDGVLPADGVGRHARWLLGLGLILGGFGLYQLFLTRKSKT